MNNIFDLTVKLCDLNGASGNEGEVRDFILKEISPYCDANVDKMGNIIAFKKGDKSPQKKVMVDAHIDEVGFIITEITESGLIRFDTVGGIDTGALICKRVKIGNTVGVIGIKAIHLSDKSEREKMPKAENLFIDIGATDKKDALKYVGIGDIGTFIEDVKPLGDSMFTSKAIDDRFGCAALITLLKNPAEYDFYATFTVGEELGLRGAKTAAFALDPDFALVLESTTASDIKGVPDEKQVCKCGEGAVLSFMDRSTLYDRRLYDFAFKTAQEKEISVQAKRFVSGGNNAGAIHLTKSGVPTLTLSLPCRYIHSPSSVADKRDMAAVLNLAESLITKMATGEILND